MDFQYIALLPLIGPLFAFTIPVSRLLRPEATANERRFPQENPPWTHRLIRTHDCGTGLARGLNGPGRQRRHEVFDSV